MLLKRKEKSFNYNLNWAIIHTSRGVKTDIFSIKSRLNSFAAMACDAERQN